MWCAEAVKFGPEGDRQTLADWSDAILRQKQVLWESRSSLLHNAGSEQCDVYIWCRQMFQCFCESISTWLEEASIGKLLCSGSGNLLQEASNGRIHLSKSRVHRLMRDTQQMTAGGFSKQDSIKLCLGLPSGSVHAIKEKASCEWIQMEHFLLLIAFWCASLWDHGSWRNHVFLTLVNYVPHSRHQLNLKCSLGYKRAEITIEKLVCCPKLWDFSWTHLTKASFCVLSYSFIHHPENVAGKNLSL